MEFATGSEISYLSTDSKTRVQFDNDWILLQCDGHLVAYMEQNEGLTAISNEHVSTLWQTKNTNQKPFPLMVSFIMTLARKAKSQVEHGDAFSPSGLGRKEASSVLCPVVCSVSRAVHLPFFKDAKFTQN